MRKLELRHFLETWSKACKRCIYWRVFFLCCNYSHAYTHMICFHRRGIMYSVIKVYFFFAICFALLASPIQRKISASRWAHYIGARTINRTHTHIHMSNEIIEIVLVIVDCHVNSWSWGFFFFSVAYSFFSHVYVLLHCIARIFVISDMYAGG